MDIKLKMTGMVIVSATLTGCIETGGGATGSSDGLSGTDTDFYAMTAPCINQAAAFSGVYAADINVVDRIRTGGGPLLVLDAGGQKLSCRQESDGSVTVFSEFAN